MKKFIIGLLSIVIIVGIFGCRKRFKKPNHQDKDSMELISQQEAEIERQREKARLDSITQAENAHRDSINVENDRRLKILDQMLNILANPKKGLKEMYKLGTMDEAVSQYARNLKYFTTDYDNDGIPELWTGRAGYIFSECDIIGVYGVNKNDKVVLIESIGQDGPMTMKDGIVYAVDYFGTEENVPWTYFKYQIKDNKFIVTELDEGMTGSDDPKYKKEPDLKELKWYPIRDTRHLRESFRFLE